MITEFSDLDYKITAEDITLETPHLKSSNKFNIININEKEDLTDSEFCSNCSPLPSEEFLFDEKIEFLESNSNTISFDNATLTYTKSINTDRDSSFGSQRVSNIITNTLPQSNDTSFSSSDLRLSLKNNFLRSHTLNTYDFLKIPNLTSLKLRSSQCEVDYFRDVRTFECKIIQEKKLIDSDDSLSREADLEPIWETPGDEKRCMWCKIC